MTVHKVMGPVTPDDILVKVREYNAGGVSTKTLWDYREGQWVEPRLTGRQMAPEGKVFAEAIGAPPGRRIAILVEEGVSYGTMKMWIAYTESEVSQQAFYDYDKAIDWLESMPE